MRKETNKGEEFRDDNRIAAKLPATVIKELAKQDDAKAWMSVVGLFDLPLHTDATCECGAVSSLNG